MTQIFSATEKLVDLILSFRLLASSEAVVRPRPPVAQRTSAFPRRRTIAPSVYSLGCG